MSFTALLAMALASPAARPTPQLIPESLSSVSPPAVRIATLAPLRPDEVRSVLRTPVRKYLGPEGRVRGGLRLSPDGRAHDGGCDPAACEGHYVLAGNRVSVDWGMRGRQVISFYMARDGVVYAAGDEGRRTGLAVPW